MQGHAVKSIVYSFPIEEDVIQALRVKETHVELFAFSCVNLDSMRVCGIIWRKWSCVLSDGEMK